MTPERLDQIVAFLQTLGLETADPEGPGATATALAPIEEALTHSSLGQARNHEKLEFLGDAVLRLAATDFLRQEHGTLTVGEQSALRNHLVSDHWLATLGERCGLGEVMRLGPMASGDLAGRATLLAEITEALLGGIYLAWGAARGLEVISRWLGPHWRDTAAAILADSHRRNWKSALQEWSQGRGLGLPRYASEEKSLVHGDPRRFFCVVSLPGETSDPLKTPASAQSTNRGPMYLGEGWGGSRRQAEQAAARQCLQLIDGSI